MKTVKRIVFISVLIALLAACTHDTDYNERLVQADSLMTSHPDSALHLLQDIPTDSLRTKADRAYYALLLTQARDKNYVAQTDDSLIRTAVQYYDSMKDNKMQAQAYYLWGSVCRDKNKQTEAIEKYIRATDFAQKAADKVLLGRIYANAGYIYYLQEFYAKADSIYRQAEQISIQLKDTSLQISSLTMQGSMQLYQKDYQQAEKKLLQAESLLKDVRQNAIKANVFSALSTLYTRTGKSTKALQYAKQNFKLQKDTLHCYRTFLELGDAYYQTGQYDSATIYIRKSLSSSSYSTKEAAYMRLADIARAQGDISWSLNMEQLYSTYKDSTNLSRQRTGIIETEQTIEMLHQQTLYESYLKEYRYYILCSILIGIGSIYLLRKRYLKKFHQQRQKALLKEKELRSQYLFVKEETKQKEEQIAALQQKIIQKYIDEVQKEQMQKELEKLNKQHIVLLKKVLEYSDVYNKMKQIISDCKEHGISKVTLTDDEWIRFMAEIEKTGTLSKLAVEYKFSKNETHYCYLLFTDFSIKERMQILKIAHATLYRTEQRICRKMNVPYQANELQKLLKSITNSTPTDT
ncbi:hypothetical protein [Bacteroides fluxus]|nr:hypothetical protein [Bacteroides fluxus]